MKKFRLRLLFIALIMIGLIYIIQVPALASNENIEILKDDLGNYLIYIKDNLKTNFTFAFSTTKDDTSLMYKNSQLDSTQKNANSIAYVDSELISDFKDNKSYMWVKNQENKLVMSGLEVDLSKALTKKEIEVINNISKTIEAKEELANPIKKIINNKEVIIIKGKEVINEQGDFKYQLIEIENSGHIELIDLIERISEMNSETDIYTKLSIYRNFNDLYTDFFNTVNKEQWINAATKEIHQPDDSETGDKYILLLQDSQGTTDARFLVSSKEYEEEKIQEKISTKLPVTYDNNILLISLGITLVIIICIVIRIRTLKNKEG